jgi:hypothetical protein
MWDKKQMKSGRQPEKSLSSIKIKNLS